MSKKQKKSRTKKPRLPMRWLMLVGVVLLFFIIGTYMTIKINQVKDRQILFEVVHFSWVGWEHGFYIDSEGDVYNYDLREENYFFGLFREFYYDWRRPSAPYKTTDLFRTYGFNSEYSHTIPKEELDSMYALVDAIEAGEYDYTGPMMLKNPPSGTVYNAFRFDKDSRLYEPIMVHHIGYREWWSETPEGDTLYCWLKKVGYGDTDCMLRDEIVEVKGN